MSGSLCFAPMSTLDHSCPGKLCDVVPTHVANKGGKVAKPHCSRQSRQDCPGNSESMSEKSFGSVPAVWYLCLEKCCSLWHPIAVLVTTHPSVSLPLLYTLTHNAIGCSLTVGPFAGSDTCVFSVTASSRQTRQDELHRPTRKGVGQALDVHRPPPPFPSLLRAPD